MFILRDRADYRGYLEHMLKMLQGQRDILATKKDQRHQDGMEYGLGLALEALTEWEQQAPDVKPTPPVATPTQVFEGPEGAVDSQGNQLDWCDP